MQVGDVVDEPGADPGGRLADDRQGDEGLGAEDVGIRGGRRRGARTRDRRAGDTRGSRPTAEAGPRSRSRRPARRGGSATASGSKPSARASPPRSDARQRPERRRDPAIQRGSDETDAAVQGLLGGQAGAGEGDDGDAMAVRRERLGGPECPGVVLERVRGDEADVQAGRSRRRPRPRPASRVMAARGTGRRHVQRRDPVRREGTPCAPRIARGEAREGRRGRGSVQPDQDHPALGRCERARPTRCSSAGRGTGRRASPPRAGRRPNRSGRRPRGAGAPATTDSRTAVSRRRPDRGPRRDASSAARVPGWRARMTGRSAARPRGAGRPSASIASGARFSARWIVANRYPPGDSGSPRPGTVDARQHRRVADLAAHPRGQVLHQVADTGGPRS